MHRWQTAGSPLTAILLQSTVSVPAHYGGGTKDDLYTITTPAYTDTDMMVEYAKLMKEGITSAYGRQMY